MYQQSLMIKKRFVIGFANMPYQQLMSKKAFGWRLTRLLSGFKERNQRFCSINLHCFTPATHSQKPNRTQACEQKPKCLAASDRFGLQRWISDHIQFRILPYELAHADMMGIGPIPPITKTPQVLTLDTWNAVILDNFFWGTGVMCTAYYSENWKIVYVQSNYWFEQTQFFWPLVSIWSYQCTSINLFSSFTNVLWLLSKLFFPKNNKNETTSKQLLPGYVGYMWETPGLPSWLLRQSWWTLVGCSWNKCSSHGTRTAKCSIAGGGRGGNSNMLIASSVVGWSNLIIFFQLGGSTNRTRIWRHEILRQFTCTRTPTKMPCHPKKSSLSFSLAKIQVG